MVNKLFCVLMLFFSFSLFAQNANNVKSNTKNSASEDDAFSETRQENVLRQPFAWESMGDVTKYEILIERFDEEKNRYVRHLLHITNEEETQRCKIYISPILSPSKYRATITPFNILGQKAVSFAFNHEFTVSAAHAPTLEEVLFDKSNANILYLDLEGENAIFEIRGKNLLPPVKDGDEVWYTTYSLRRGKTIVYCPTMISHSSDNTSIRLQVPTSKLGQGKYHLHAQDASGLYSENDISVFVTLKKKLDIEFSADYAFPILLHTSDFANFIGTRIFPANAALNFEIFPFKNWWGNIGFGLLANYTRINGKQDDYAVVGNTFNIFLDLAYQIMQFGNRLAFEGRVGFGLSTINALSVEFEDGEVSDRLNTLCPSIVVGFTTQFFIVKGFYAAGSIDYVLALNKDMPLGFLVPSVGLGYHF